MWAIDFEKVKSKVAVHLKLK
ncbi:hypothetical protein Goklo_009333, partial [Gossypium klotzschianum]|nr:hypothetical protein [Gossypium klotzschianum]